MSALIDVCLFTVAVFVLFFFISKWIVDMDGAALHQTRGTWIFQTVIFIGAALYLAFEAYLGKTFGKACLGLKVLSTESHRFRRALIVRWIFRCLPLTGGIAISIAMLVWLQFQADSSFVESFGRDLVFPLILPLATLLIMYLLARIPLGIERQSWYDLAAGTRVIRRRNCRSARGFEPIIKQ